MKRIFTILLSAALIFTGMPLLPQNSSHAAKQHWAVPYLNNLVKSDVMRGDQDGNLRPNSNITRAEFVTMVNRAFGYSQKGKANFSDVPKGAWYSDDLNIAKTQGYMQGVEANKANPKGSLTREQAVTLICRALKIEGIETDTFKFDDSRQFSQWSKEYINATVLKQIVNGYPDSTFRPKNSMTRGEMAKVLSNLAGEIIREEGNNYIGYADKNVSMVQSGANLRDTIIPGDLFLTAGLGKGYTLLDKVVVNGELIVSGTGNSESGKVSVLLKDTDINHLIIDSQSSDIMSVRAEGGSVIEKSTIKRNAYLEEDNDRNIAFKDVMLKGVSGTKLNLSGNFENVKVMAPNNQLSLSKGYINSLTVDEEAEKGSVFLEKDTKVDALMIDTATTVTGSGTVEQVVINADGTNISMLPKKIYIRPGIKAVINGRTMTSLDGDANNANPAFLPKYPQVTEIQATTAKLLAKVNKPGKIFWAVKDLSAVNAGANEESLMKPDKRYFVSSGNQVAVAEKELTFQMRPLKSGQTYEYYIMFEDLNKQKTEIEAGRFTTVDTIAPQFLSSTPVISGKTKSSLDFNVMASKDATLYWAVFKNKATPPTPESLAEQKVSGAIGKGKRSVSMNESYNITVRGTDDKILEEHQQYDVYFVLRDASGNLSKLSKKIESTQDETPPEFYQGYPWNEPGGASNVTIRTMSTESGTLYWAAYPQDSKFPPVDDFHLKSPEEQRELKIRAVTTGQKAFKNGQKPVKEKIDEKLIVTGLEKAKPYDIYFALKDKAGNYSDVKVLKAVKTLDKAAPKAVMEFNKAIDGDPLISSDVTIKFDEIVYYDDPVKAVRLLDLQNDPTRKAQILQRMVILHDLRKVTQPDYYTNIDFSRAILGEKEGQSYITFPASAFGSNHQGLNSGGTYQFELNNVVDSDGNRMNQSTRLKPFNVVPPQIGLQLYTGSLELNEIGFTTKKIDEINSDSFYDVIITVDRTIVFDLYEKESAATNFPSDPVAKKVRLDKNNGKSITKMVKGRDFALFSGVKDMDYKLVIKELDTIKATYNTEFDGAASWDGDINLKATVVTGTKGELSNLSNAILNRTNVMDIVDKNKLVIKVSNPKYFTTTRTYADMAPPRIIGAINFPEEARFDTTVYATVMTDKPAEIYYVVIPKADFIDKGNMVPTVDQVLAGRPSYIEGKTGKITLTAGNVDVREFINDLKPDTEYKFFYVIKGKSTDNLEVRDTHKPSTANPEPVDPAYTDFKTKEPIQPEILIVEGVQQLMPSGESTETTAVVKGTAKSEATLYWVSYVHSNTPQIAETEVDTVLEIKDNDSLKTDSGSFPLTIAKDLDPKKEGIQFEFTVKNMLPIQGYDVFVALKNEYSNAKSPKVYQLNGVLRSIDKNPPTIVGDTNTVILEVTQGADGRNSYKAGINVAFSKALYFGNTAAVRDPEPLTEDKIFDKAKVDTDSNSLTYGTYEVKMNGMLSAPPFTKARGLASVESESEAIKSMQLYFSNLRDGTTVNMTGYIYSRAGWYAGQFKMVFREDPPTYEEVEELVEVMVDGKPVKQVVKIKKKIPPKGGHFEVMLKK